MQFYILNPRLLSFLIVALNAIISAKENRHEGQASQVWFLLSYFYCRGHHRCQEIYTFLPWILFLPMIKISWYPRPKKTRFLFRQGSVVCKKCIVLLLDFKHWPKILDFSENTLYLNFQN